MTSDKYSPPKYFQICRRIVGAIQRGELTPGAPVASENEIIERYGVSNTTARKVLHELEQEGWVTRVKGKGTFVRDFPVLRSINRIFGFTRNMIEAGRKPATRPWAFTCARATIRKRSMAGSTPSKGRSARLSGCAWPTASR